MDSDTRIPSPLSSSTPSQITTTSGIYTSTILLSLFAIYILFSAAFTLATYRVLRVLTRPRAARLHSRTTKQPHETRQSTKLLHRSSSGSSNDKSRRHLLIVLGSGGHTSEMLSILQNLGAEYLNTRFARRTWVVSTGDGFSAERASGFERAVAHELAYAHKHKQRAGTLTANNADVDVDVNVHWDIVTVTRARKVHQPLYTTPVSALVCLWDCIRVLRGSLRTSSSAGDIAASTSTPDLILTNGPGTGVIVVLASLVLLALGLAPLQGRGSMRCVYIESWARVKTLSLSGKMLRWMVSRFLVQWKGLADDDATVVVADAQKSLEADVSISQSSTGTSTSSSLPRAIEFVGAVVT